MAAETAPKSIDEGVAPGLRPDAADRAAGGVVEAAYGEGSVGGGELRLCFHRKILLQLLDVYQARYRLFLEVYRHRVVVGLDELVGDLLGVIEPIPNHFPPTSHE